MLALKKAKYGERYGDILQEYMSISFVCVRQPGLKASRPTANLMTAFTFILWPGQRSQTSHRHATPESRFPEMASFSPLPSLEVATFRVGRMNGPTPSVQLFWNLSEMLVCLALQILRVHDLDIWLSGYVEKPWPRRHLNLLATLAKLPNATQNRDDDQDPIQQYP
jgi:hypothetical protein